MLDHVASFQIEREVPAENGTLDGCIWLTEEQADLMLKDRLREMQEKMQGRRKRNLDRNIPLGYNKWQKMPIKWKFNNQHSK